MFDFAIDGITSFSVQPLRIITLFGSCFFAKDESGKKMLVLSEIKTDNI